MKALLIIAHGSRSADANEEVHRLAERIGRRAEGTLDRVAHAFLEIADPGVAPMVKELAEAGMTEIRIFPYFLAAGAHVMKDIPRVVGEARNAHPDIRFEVLPYLGALEGMPALVMELIESTAGGQETMRHPCNAAVPPPRSSTERRH